MKFSAATALAMAAMVSAQSVADIPDCARPCLEKAVKDKTSCATTDYACICKAENFSAIRGAATSCVLEKCGTETAIGEVLPATQKLCAGAGDKPDSSASASASASAPATMDTAAPSTAAPSVSATPCETQSEPAVTDCAPTAPANGTAPGPSAPVIAGAAGLAPVGGLAMVAMVALAL